jgi:hypothetical protein
MLSMNQYYVYAYLDPRKPGNFQYGEWQFDAEPLYIGYGKGDRKEFHLREANYHSCNTNPHKKRRIQAILRDNLKPIIIVCKDNIEIEEARSLERFLIRLIGRDDLSTGPLLNLTDGGEGLYNPSEEVRKKIGDRKYHYGKDNIFYGKNAWKEWRAEGASEETRKKLSAARLGKSGTPHTKEWKKNHSQRMSGEGNSNFGKRGELSPCFGTHHSEETKKKISERARKVPCIIDNIEYSSAKEAAKMLNIGYWAARYRAGL